MDALISQPTEATWMQLLFTEQAGLCDHFNGSQIPNSKNINVTEHRSYKTSLFTHRFESHSYKFLYIENLEKYHMFFPVVQVLEL